MIFCESQPVRACLPAQADFISYREQLICSLMNLPCCFSHFDVIIAKALSSHCIAISIYVRIKNWKEEKWKKYANYKWRL